jgi:hypothetical protein
VGLALANEHGSDEPADDRGCDHRRFAGGEREQNSHSAHQEDQSRVVATAATLGDVDHRDHAGRETEADQVLADASSGLRKLGVDGEQRHCEQASHRQKEREFLRVHRPIERDEDGVDDEADRRAHPDVMRQPFRRQMRAVLPVERVRLARIARIAPGAAPTDGSENNRIGECSPGL